MTSPETDRLLLLLKLVSDPVRHRMLLRLAEQEVTVAALRADLDIVSNASFYHNIRYLRVGGLIKPDRRGKRVFYQPTETGRRLVTALDTMAAALATQAT